MTSWSRHNATQNSTLHVIRRMASIVGKCLLMCPRQERVRREKERRLHVLEMKGTSRDHSKTSESLAVKEFVRSAAGCDLAREEWLRPPVVLLATINYLLRTDLAWLKVYEFIDDRIRAVRQDLVIQASEGVEAIDILEKCTRFYLYAQYRLRLQHGKFDVKLNTDHIGQCLARLTDLYNKNLTVNNNEAEMMAYSLLYRIGSHDVVTRVLQREHIRGNTMIKQAVKINKLLLTHNFVKFFKEVKRLPPLSQCALLIHLDELKRNALKVLDNAYGVGNAVLPLCKVSHWLGFSTVGEASHFITSQGVQVSDDNVIVKKNRQYKANSTSPFMTCQYHVINDLELQHSPSTLINTNK